MDKMVTILGCTVKSLASLSERDITRHWRYSAAAGLNSMRYKLAWSVSPKNLRASHGTALDCLSLSAFNLGVLVTILNIPSDEGAEDIKLQQKVKESVELLRLKFCDVFMKSISLEDLRPAVDCLVKKLETLADQELGELNQNQEE